MPPPDNAVPEPRDAPLEIRTMSETDDWEALAALLHEAYREHAQAGRNYAACTQSAEETRQRCAGGTTLLAFVRGRLAGTATLHEQRRHGRPPSGYVSQVAVSPGFRHMGIAKRLLDRLEQMAKDKGWSVLDCNTAASARSLVAWYQRLGWQKVSLRSFPATSYYSVLFRKRLDGRKPAPGAWRYPLDCLVCRLLWRRDGSLRLPGRLARRLGLLPASLAKASSPASEQPG